MEDEQPRKAEGTKLEESEEVGLEGLAPNALGEQRDPEDLPPAEETRAPHDDA